MAPLVRLILAVAVITGWVLALTWLALSVSQIAVREAVAPTLCVVAGPGEVACSP
jgi:hypothetical protein